MSAPSGTEFIQDCNSYCEEIASSLGTSTELSASQIAALTESSPAVLEPSKDRWRNLTFVERFLTRPRHFSPSETVPILSGNRPNERDTEQMNRRVERRPNCCTTAINCYKKYVTKFRNSAFIYIVQIVFSLIPFSAIVMGLLFAESCPKVSFLPVFGAVTGIIGAIFMSLWIGLSCINVQGEPCSNRQSFLLGVACILLLIVTALDASFVCSLSPSFDPTSNEYCNETFYTYSFYKEIATAVAIVLSAIIYLPGSCHILCCYDRCMGFTPKSSYFSI